MTYILQVLFLFIFIIPRKLSKDSLICKHFYSSSWRPGISYRHAEEQTQYLPVYDRYLPWHTRSLSTVLNFSRRYVCQGIWKRLPRKLNRNVTRELFIEHAFFHATRLTILTLHLESWKFPYLKISTANTRLYAGLKLPLFSILGKNSAQGT